MHLLDSLEIKNFVVHEDLKIDFAKLVTLIIGDNGSGKTLILDCIKLALGAEPDRFKKTSLSQCIGPFDDKAEIVLSLHNPIINEEIKDRLFNDQLLSETLGKHLINQSRLKIRVLITLENWKIWLNGVSASRRKIRDIIRTVGINPYDPLVFAEQNAVDRFNDDSDSVKFEKLIEATGLNLMRERYSESLETLDMYKKRRVPRSLALNEANKLLQILERKKHEFERKKRLESELDDLNDKIDLSKVKDLEIDYKRMIEQIDQIKVQYNQVENEFSRLTVEIETKENKIAEFTKSKELLGDQIEKERKTLFIKTGRKNTLEQNLVTQNKLSLEKNTNLLKEKENKLIKLFNFSKETEEKYLLIEKKRREIEELKSKIEKKTLEKVNLDHQIEVMQDITSDETYLKLNDELKQVENRIYNLEAKQIKISRKEKVKEVKLPKKALTSIKVRNFFKKNNVNVIGPIFQEITFNDPNWNYSLHKSLEPYLYRFFTKDYESYDIANTLFKESDFDFLLDLGVLKGESFIEPNFPQKDFIYNTDLNLIQDYCSPETLAYLQERKKPTIIAYDQKDDSILLRYAIKNKIYIVSQDGISFLPSGDSKIKSKRYRKPKSLIGLNLSENDFYNESEWLDVTNELTTLKSRQYDLYKLQRTRKTEIEDDSAIKTLKEKRDNLSSQISDYEVKLNKFNEELNDFSNVDSSISDIQNDILELQEIIEQQEVIINTNKSDIESLEKEMINHKKILSEFNEKEEDFKTTIEELTREIKVLTKNHINIETQFESINTSLAMKKEEKDSQQKRIIEFREEIQYNEPVPDEIPLLENLTTQIAEIEGFLENINVTEEDIQNWLEQSNAVKFHEENLTEINDHINELEKETNFRKKEWVTRLNELELHLNSKMNFLLSSFLTYNVYFKNMDNPKKTEMVIEAKREERKNSEFIHFSLLSGGERILTAQCLMLVLQSLGLSPIKIIDEFTQRLIKEKHRIALQMVFDAITQLKPDNMILTPQIVIVAPEFSNIDLNAIIRDPGVSLIEIVPTLVV